MTIKIKRCKPLHPHLNKLDYTDKSWIGHLGKFLTLIGGRVETRGDRVVAKQRGNDQPIMEVARDGLYNLPNIQQVRMYLKVTLLSDISDISGTTLLPGIFRAPGRRSILDWPNQGEPSKEAWKEWRRFLTSLLTTYGKSQQRKILLPRYRTREWYCTKQVWEWIGSGKTIMSASGHKYTLHGTEYLATHDMIEYNRMKPIAVITRNGHIVRVKANHGVSIRETGTSNNNEPDFVRKIQQDYRRLAGHIMPTHRLPALENKTNAFVAATDGSVRNGRGSAATSLNTTGENLGVLITRVPVDGHSQSLTSYRAELAGLVAILIIIKSILIQQGGKYNDMTGTIYCDNKASVIKYAKLQGDRPYLIKQAPILG